MKSSAQLSVYHTEHTNGARRVVHSVRVMSVLVFGVEEHECVCVSGAAAAAVIVAVVVVLNEISECESSTHNAMLDVKVEKESQQ